MSDLKVHPFDTRVPLIHELLGDGVDYRTWDNDLGGKVHVIADPADTMDVFHRQEFERSDLMRQIGGEGLIFSDGSLWLEQRRIAQPHFHERVMDQYFEAIYNAIDGVVDRIDSCIEHDKPFLLADEMIRFTVRTTYKSFFGVELSKDHDVGTLLTRYFDAIGKITLAIMRRGKSIPTKSLVDFQLIQKEIRGEIDRIMSLRSDLGSSDDDLVGSFQKKIDPELLKDEIQTFFLAGAETTSNLMSWLILLLEAGKTEQARVVKEVDSAVSGDRCQPEEIADMPFLRAVMDETMRLYPPVWLPTRQVTRDTMLNGREVAAKDWFFVCVYLLHRNHNLWEDPHLFRPDRFLVDKDEIARYAYAPFGGGRHLCIGKHFAELETMLLTATLLKKFRFERVDDIPLDPWPGLTLKPSVDVPMRAYRR